MTMQRNQQGGFTLIELAIVLVIIGLILGAILKGQDLIVGARGKKFINWVQQWKTLQLAHLDRKGRYAGDQIETRTTGTGGTYRGDGVIGNGSTSEIAFSDEITTAKGFVDLPDSTIVLGNSAFYMSMGFDWPVAAFAAGGSGGASVTQSEYLNVILVTTADGVAQALTVDEVAYMEMLDVAIDGVADAGSGRVQAIIGTGFGFTQGVGGNKRIVVDTNNPIASGTAWTPTTHTGMLYFFDRDPNAL
jgi:prepilin-type N-terminal cleavage/methylation domain-containing protein